MKFHQWIGIALLVTGAGIAGRSVFGVDTGGLGVALVVWWAGSLLAPANPFASGLSNPDWLRRWTILATLAVLVPVVVLVILPSIVSGLAFFYGNLLLVRFDVPFWSQAASQPRTSASTLFSYLLVVLLGVLWPFYWSGALYLTAREVWSTAPAVRWRLAKIWQNLILLVALAAAMPISVNFLI